MTTGPLEQVNRSAAFSLFRISLLGILLCSSALSHAQEEEKASKNKEKGKWGEIHGNVQFDAQYYNPTRP
jgi:hypothetical protein